MRRILHLKDILSILESEPPVKRPFDVCFKIVFGKKTWWMGLQEDTSGYQGIQAAWEALKSQN